MTGEKTVTRRLANDRPSSPWWQQRCSMRVSSTYAVCPGRGQRQIGRVRILGIRRERIGTLTDDEAHREGFPHASAFEQAFAEINGGVYDPNVLVYRVEFEAVDSGGDFQ